LGTITENPFPKRPINFRNSARTKKMIHLILLVIIHQLIILLRVKYFFNLYSTINSKTKNYTEEETIYSASYVFSWIFLLVNFLHPLIFLVIIINLIPFKKWNWIGYLFSALLNVIILGYFCYLNLDKFI
jgi:hypothetical protein